MASRPRRWHRVSITLWFAALVLSWTNPVNAQSILDDSGKRWKILLGSGFTYGGDKLASNVRTDGRSDDIRAGRLIQLFAGVQVRLTPSWHTSLTGGYHYETANSYYGAAHFARYPVEWLTHYTFARSWRIGGGIRAALSPSLVGRGDAAFLNEKFEDTVSPVVEIEYLMTRQQGFKLRYVRERFRSESDAPSVRADHLGLMVTWYF